MDQVELIKGVETSPLKIIESEFGAVRHGLRKSEAAFHGFGEAYFSIVNQEVIKGWKKHTKMHSNLIVTQGAIRFILYDDRKNSQTDGCYMDLTLSPENSYARLYIPPMIWLAFQGVGTGVNMLLNISSIEHDPDECLKEPLSSNQFPNIL